MSVSESRNITVLVYCI